jgi:hypothetical protein
LAWDPLLAALLLLLVLWVDFDICGGVMVGGWMDGWGFSETVAL